MGTSANYKEILTSEVLHLQKNQVSFRGLFGNKKNPIYLCAYPPPGDPNAFIK